MMETSSTAQLAIVGGVLALFLTGVSVAGTQSLRSRGEEPRVRRWLAELWGYSAGLAMLIYLSMRIVGFDFWLGWANVREGRLAAGAYALAVVGIVAGFGCGFRAMALVRDGIGQLAATEPDVPGTNGGHGPREGPEDDEEQGSEGSGNDGR
jgi:hypothetical protein